MSLYDITTKFGTFSRRAWTGGDVPTTEAKRSPIFQAIRREFFQESLRECCGLDYWTCAGTSSMERARIFWNHANLDAHRTLSAAKGAR